MSTLQGHPFNDETAERVGCIVYDVDGKLLVVEGFGKYGLPKGCRYFGETEWDGGVRELWEETGLDIEEMLSSSMATFKEKKKLRWGTYNVFKLRVRGEGLSLRPQAGETTKVCFKAPQGRFLQGEADVNADLRFLLQEFRIPTHSPYKRNKSSWGFKTSGTF
jgi:8-oxo-dGTP pyrophosphatase MutT (NUDIX family)